MPNYRSKNKGRRNKNRNKSSNQNRNKQEQQQRDRIESKEDATKPNDEELLLQHQEYYQRQIGCIPKMLSGDRSSNHCDSITNRRTPPTAEAHTVLHHPSGLPSSERLELQTSAGAKSNVSADTVSGDSTKRKSDGSPINVRTLGDGKNHSLSSEMGANGSKEGSHPLDHASVSPHSVENFLTPQQGKVIVHRLIKQDTTMKDDEGISTSQLNERDSRISKHTEQMQRATQSPTYNSADFVMIINSNPTETPENNGSTDQEAGFIVDNMLSQRYHEDSPQTPSTDDHICTEIRKRKWCSSNDEEVTQVPGIAGSSLLGTEAQFDLTVDDGPLWEPSKPNKESYKQRRAEKRAAIETHFLPQFLSPRYLDSIMEENSDMSDARSEKSDGTLSRSASGNFGDESNDQHYTKAQKATETFPRSNLDFSKTHKHGSVPKVPTLPASIREETSPSIVETKIIEQPEAADGCAIWSSIQSPESEVAEIVYINSASSSVSDLMELDYEENMATKRLISIVDLDTDVLEVLHQNQSTKPNIGPAVVETEKRKVHNEQLLSAVDLKALAADPTHVKTKSKITTAITSTSTPTSTEITNEQAMKQCKTSEQLREAHRLNTSSVPSALASGSHKEGSTAEHKHTAENYSSTASDSDGSSRSPVSSISIVNTIVPFSGLIPKAQMNDIREILNDAAKESGENASNPSKRPQISPHRVSPNHPFECVHSSYGLPTPTSPSPQFSPTGESVTSTDITTGEAVVISNFQNHTDTPHATQRHLADAPNTNSCLVRQDSADSFCSGSTSSCQSHCTAIDTQCGSLPPHDCTNSDAESSVSGNISVPTTAAESANLNAVSAAPANGSSNSNDLSSPAIKKLRLLCTETLASLPYGDEILEELASVAQNIGELRATQSVQKSNDMPYPLPTLPHISDIQVSVNKDPRKSTQLDPGHMLPSSSKNEFSSAPPPVPQPPRAYNCWLGVPTESDPKLLICLSPSQRSLMEGAKMPGGHKPDHLLDAHKKFIERRGYHEYTAEQVLNAMSLEKAAEHKVIETTSMMKQLRKSLTPPPSIPPPPIPRKCFDKNSRMQNTRKAPQAVNNCTGSCGNAGEQRSLFDGNEENKHRLLAIIHDDTNEIKQDQSSDENNSRPTSKIAKQTQSEQEKIEPQEHFSTPLTQKNEKKASVSEQLKHYASNVVSSTDSGHSALCPQSSQAKSPVSSSSPSAVPQSEEGNCAKKFPKSDSFAHKMQSIDSKFSQSPAMGYMDNLDSVQKRFSNVETSCHSEVISLRPKRYSNVETSSYESEKRIENGRVVYDTNNSTHESLTEGDKFNSIPHFPVKDLSQRSEWSHISSTKSDSEKQTSFATTVKISPNLKVNSNADEIMSALILNTPVAVGETEAPTSCGGASVCVSSDSKVEERETEKEIHEKIEMSKNKEGSDSTLYEHITTSKEHRENEHFRQRAKEEEVTNNNRKPKTTFHFDHEKLFKDFDDLSLQLNKELESGKLQKEQRERSASLYDLSRLQTESKTRFEELKNRRLEHMQELEHEIERSLLARRFKKLKDPENIACQPHSEQDWKQPKPLTFEIPIRIETDNSFPAAASSMVENKPCTVEELSVDADPDYSKTSRLQADSRQNESLHQRAESMFDLSDKNTSQYRQRTASTGQARSNFANDWMRYADDLGSSENITRPFAREVEICYQRSRPHVIRAPRLTASTHDLSYNNNYDSNNAYNVRRTHAPMLSQEPKKSRSRYLSCHSMIERDPNPTYISTTSRPAASPAPPSLHHAPQSKVTQHRRASLPREIHEQQLSYIANKEEELKTEFERLEMERRRLLGEMNRAPPVPMHMTRNTRDAYRPAPNLPTLSEDEVFRQQMAEEWLSKIAEREERRLQKIIKVSKISEEKICGIPPTQPPSCTKNDIGNEFLKRVKERRSKLEMPSDSDWESGAESHPTVRGHASETDEVPPVKILEGRIETDMHQMPKHLREFAKFSNDKFEELVGEHRETHHEEERRQERNENSVSGAVKKTSITKTYNISRIPESQTAKTSSEMNVAKSGMESNSKEGALNGTEFPYWTTSMPPTFANRIPTTPFVLAPKHPLPATFSQMFAASPFKSRIYEEFDNYWQKFEFD